MTFPIHILNTVGRGGGVILTTHFAQCLSFLSAEQANQSEQ